jgi:hypothetical protein
VTPAIQYDPGDVLVCIKPVVSKHICHLLYDFLLIVRIRFAQEFCTADSTLYFGWVARVVERDVKGHDGRLFRIERLRQIACLHRSADGEKVAETLEPAAGGNPQSLQKPPVAQGHINDENR